MIKSQEKSRQRECPYGCCVNRNGVHVKREKIEHKAARSYERYRAVYEEVRANG